jgi:Flp pilus assembly protein TadG
VHQLQLISLLRRFRTDNRAVAVVEFAIIVPFLITLYFGTVEAASLYSADRRVATVAGTMGDLVSRIDGTITSSTLTDYFQAAQGIMQPYSTTGLKQVVSVLTVASNGTATVYWSRGYNGGVARTTNSTFTMTAAPQMNLLARAVGYLVVSEIKYPYKPLFGMVISSTINLGHVEYYLPRLAKKIDIS